MAGSRARRAADRKSYPLNQCALYKLRSKAKLATLLRVDVDTLHAFCADEGNYKVFEIAESTCPFTSKVKKARWVQDPVPRLKQAQSRIANFLARIEVPDYCHGATPGRSYRSNAAVHRESVEAATLDLKSFFPATKAARVYDFFRYKLLCEPDVSWLLTEICTFKGALATGSPVSPILSFWANRDLFDSIDRRAAETKLQLSAYVDDITLSGDKVPASIESQIAGIVKSFGHNLSPGKTKVFRRGAPKHITGVVVHGRELKVPFSRFHKARGIMKAMRRASTVEEKLELAAKLSGLLGEAASIDRSYRALAESSYRSLADLTGR